jgi:hypothetical protein
MLTPDRAADMRTSDAERQRVADFLRDCCAEGRLTPDELEERLDRAYRARTQGELRELAADLPPVGGAVAPQPSAAVLEANEAAFRRQLIGFLTANLVVNGIWLLSGAEGSWWPGWVLLFSAVILFNGFLHRKLRVERDVARRREGGAAPRQ